MHEANQGGVVTLLFPHLISSVISQCSDPMHMIVWILLSLNNYSFAIVNVYAPNDVVERSHLWHWIMDQLPRAT